MEESRAVVWDLDGVIVDSGQVHNRSWAELAAEYGLAYDPDTDFKGIFGRHNTDIMSSLWQVTDPGRVDEMARRKESLFRDAARSLKPLPGVPELMQALREAGWKQGIGSSAPIQNVRLLLDVTGLARYMDAIASGEDVERGKPDPQVFLLAFSRLGVDPANGVVVEDAPTGIQASNAAGAATLGVTNTQTSETLSEAGAHLVVDSLEGIDVSDLERLVEQNSSSGRAPTEPA